MMSGTDETVIKDLMVRLESGTRDSSDWNNDIRRCKDPVIVCDSTLSIIGANEAFFSLSRYDPSGFCGQKLRDLPVSMLSGESAWDCALTRRAATGVVELSLPAGIFLRRLKTLPVTDANGGLIYLLLILTDHENEPDLVSYDTIRQSISDPADILVQTDGALLSVSGPAASLLGSVRVSRGGSISRRYHFSRISADRISLISSIPYRERSPRSG